VLVVNQTKLDHEPLWKKSSVLMQGESIKLAVKVVSTNWRDDYGRKLFDYEAMDIAEYWIVDFRVLGARRFIGSSKTPTLSLYTLVDDEYQVRHFRGGDRVESPTFPDLKLTTFPGWFTSLYNHF
jgi:Uma2 family endonuclease